MIKLELPYPPSVNSYWLNSRGGGHKYISKKGVEFRKKVLECVSEQLIYHNSISTPIQLEILVYPPDRRIRDLDNILKALFDALTNAEVYDDDSQINYFSMERKEIIKLGKVVVIIK